MCIRDSYTVKHNLNYYSRWAFVSPDNKVRYYDKRHLFSMGGEDKHISAGKSRLDFSFRGMKISPYICYDLRFPVWSRNNEVSDLLIYSATVSYTHLRAHETVLDLVCRLL